MAVGKVVVAGRVRELGNGFGLRTRVMVSIEVVVVSNGECVNDLGLGEGM